MNLLDLFILLIAAIIATFGHFSVGAVVIITIAVLIVVHLLRGERIP